MLTLNIQKNRLPRIMLQLSKSLLSLLTNSFWSDVQPLSVESLGISFPLDPPQRFGAGYRNPLCKAGECLCNSVDSPHVKTLARHL